MFKINLILLVVLMALSGRRATAAGEELLAIGQVQGAEARSPFEGRRVTVRGVVTGLLEDQNSAGIRYHTFFIQDLPGSEDGQPQTSDGLPIFLGRKVPEVALGDVVRVSGLVQEFYGLTELEDEGLEIVVEERGRPLPPPLLLDDLITAPAPNWEAWEGMRVGLADSVIVGPTFAGCSFAVVPTAAGVERVWLAASAAGQPLLPVLHTSDVSCGPFPMLASGDRAAGLVGPLTYHFDQYKLVLQDVQAAEFDARPLAPAPALAAAAGGNWRMATFNLENFFDTRDDTGLDAEPKPDPAELVLKQRKIAAAITLLGCPTVLAVQEVEHRALLEALAGLLAADCGFTYEVSHRESPDVRGIDLALLSDPRRAVVQAVALRQSCSPVPTDVIDPAQSCPAGQNPLFSRPPLQVQLALDGRPVTLFVNHFKSKRGGERETRARRVAQADFLNELVAELLNQDPGVYVVVMGDFNDDAGSLTWQTMLEGGHLQNSLQSVPEAERYSYIFGGYSQLIDWLLLSPALQQQVRAATILHLNADYPAHLAAVGDALGLPRRASDHDIPLVELAWETADSAEPPNHQPDMLPWLLGLGLLAGAWLAERVFNS